MRSLQFPGDDFDVVESEPDEVESSSDEDIPQTETKETKEQKRINKRLKEIGEVWILFQYKHDL